MSITFNGAPQAYGTLSNLLFDVSSTEVNNNFAVKSTVLSDLVQAEINTPTNIFALFAVECSCVVSTPKL
jgi:uncharacterized caspase-like protein